MSNLPTKDAPWLKESAAKRHAATVKKFTDAMKEIELDIQRNENIYPFNGGTINQAEVCRRAGVAKALLQGPAHKATTKIMVDNWLADIKSGLINGRRNVRKAVTTRADDWKEEHRKLATAYRIDMHRLEMAQARIAELTAETAALREQLAMSGSNVRAIRPKRKKSDDS